VDTRSAGVSVTADGEAMTEDKIRILSMGWGVQTWALAAMVALGDLPPVDYVVHADTGHEMADTYEFAAMWTPWLEERGQTVIVVRDPDPHFPPEDKGVVIPAYTVNRETGKHGQIHRECTNNWKVRPLRLFARDRLVELGIKRVSNSVEMVMGISLDEFIRMRDSNVGYVQNVYPLVDARITRAGCIDYLKSHDLPIPPKSACTFCPYSSKVRWKELKRAGGPDWAEAVAVDEALRSPVREAYFDGDLYVHSSGKPLPEAIKIPEDYGAEQLSLDDGCESGFCWV
jgi:hypothetical protein